MPDLFAAADPTDDKPDPAGPVDQALPLAARMRPRTLAEYAGQQHILGEGRLLRRAIESDRFSSLIFYGPPGTGKTTLAHLIARTTDARFVNLSGVESTVADMRRAVAEADTHRRLNDRSTVLFIDEIHRFNKAQQDVLLPHVERGAVRLIGATTHNPLFYVNAPLVSRSQVFQLEPLSIDDLGRVIDAALTDPERGYGRRTVAIDDDARRHLATVADGDARKCLTALELAVTTTPPGADGRIVIDRGVAEESIQQKFVVYDRDGDQHYDTISAFIKSMRASDPDATAYWLAKMLHAGEDIRFIARRIVIAASEDVGLADSNALRVAVAAHQAAEFIGLPEARIILSHAALYVATAPKSNRAYLAIDKALADVRGGRTLAIPEYLRTKANRKIRRESGIDPGETYQYAHDAGEHEPPQACLPEGRVYYEPTDHGLEARIAERLQRLRARFDPPSSSHAPRAGKGGGGESG